MADIFSKDLILLDWDCKDKEEALYTIAMMMKNDGRLECADEDIEECECFQAYLQSLKDREVLDCTSVGFEFAIPHGKCPKVAKPGVFFGRLKNPILWNPEEDEYIQYCFGIAVGDSADDSHLKILAELSCSILDDDFVESIQNANTPEECYNILADIQNNIKL